MTEVIEKKQRTAYFNSEHWNYIKNLVEIGAELEERILGATPDDWVANTSELEDMTENLRSIYQILGEKNPLYLKQKWEHAEAKLKQAGVYPYNQSKYLVGEQR